MISYSLKSLDLHGTRHECAEVFVEEFFSLREPPFEIVTGNSSVMLSIVLKIAKKFNYMCSYRHENNLGSLIITEDIL